MTRLKFTCCLCKFECTGHGHNPLPLYNKEGRCCTSCNMSEVIPARLMLKKWQDGKNEKHIHSDGK
jgi:hypothetical protein